VSEEHNRRAWLVRRADPPGDEVVGQVWLPHGVVALSAAGGGELEPGAGKDRLREVTERELGPSATYTEKLQRVEELHAFLSVMRPGDVVCALAGGRLFTGEITGGVVRQAAGDGRCELRRPVSWSASAAWDELPEELRERLWGPHEVVELTAVRHLLDAVRRGEAARAAAPRELRLPEPDAALARSLLVHDAAWLRELRDLLWDERQLVLYGPPGTGKTHLALAFAEFLGGGPGQVTLVQFHPSYAYEDFFEGFRPRQDGPEGGIAFRLTAGPLRELADLAARPERRHIPHVLVIDEINRANLAKVFGELYFLLEYRDRSVRLMYSGERFALPPNLFVIGTMNTADRSIALVDAAMRRRFAFVELSPRVEPVRGLLRRWLAREGRDSEPADLLDALNSRIPDPDFAVGPSYLMKPGVYRDGGLERVWRTKILPLLAEYHYGEDVDVAERYGLEALRAALREDGPAA
jgi:5-methylcytosine-specific restriction protein B